MKRLVFEWDHQASNGETFNLYENNILAVENIASLNFSLEMDNRDPGTYDFYVTSVDIATGLESPPSEVVAVNFIQPEAPTNLRFSWDG